MYCLTISISPNTVIIKNINIVSYRNKFEAYFVYIIILYFAPFDQHYNINYNKL